MANWRFPAGHARVPLCIARDPGARLLDIAAKRRIHPLTGIGRSTIDRILAATATGGAIKGHLEGGNNHWHESGAPRGRRKAPGQSGGGSGI